MERMGFGYDELAEINPRIICAFGSGFGQTGPLAYKGGQDILAQALSGVMRRKCNPDEPLTVYATSLCDYTAGMHLVQAILLALLQREKTGRGQQVAVSLFESMLAMQMQEAAMWLQRGQTFQLGRLSPHRRVRDHRRRDRSRRRLQDQSAAGHLQSARHRRSLDGPALCDVQGPTRAQAAIAGDFPRTLRIEQHGALARRASTSRTCSARRC